MKDFLKDKPKEDFAKPTAMPEDMKELFRQRQRELAAERAQFSEDASKTDEDQTTTTPTTTGEPKLEQMTLPPPPKAKKLRQIRNRKRNRRHRMLKVRRQR